MNRGVNISFAAFLTLCACGGGTSTWPRGKVPFVAIGFTPDEYATIYTAMIKWQLASGGRVQFLDVLLTDAPDGVDALVIIKTPPAPAALTNRIGYNNGSSVFLPDGFTERIVLHELGHVLGLIDEQSREDRDLFVRVLWENIPPALVTGWMYQDSILYDVREFPYDYLSVMHYHKIEAGIDWTSTPGPMGSDNISIIDAIKIQYLYEGAE